MKKTIILFLFLMLFFSASKISAQCTTGSQYPVGIFQATGAAGSNTINSDARTGEYTYVHIEPSKYYTFSTSVSTDYITITNDTGTQVIASGVTPVSFVSVYNQTVRYYIHQNAQCETTNQFVRARKVTWVTAPPCLDPTPAGVTNITPISCTINLTPPSTAPTFGYDAYVSTSSTTPGETVPTSDSTTSSILVTNLNPDTTYHYWLRADCQYQKGEWIYGGTFTTISSLLCNSAYYGIYPSATITPDCNGSDEWFATNVMNGSFSNIAVVPNTEYVFKTNYSTDFITITNALGTVVLASGATPVTWNSGSTSGVVRFYSHDNAQCGYGTSTGSPRNKYVNCITSSVTCMPPSNLAVANITSNSIRMSWTAPTSVPSNGYEIYIITTNTAPTVNSTATLTNTDTTIDINGLTAGVTYYYWIRSNCGSEKSSWASGGSFTMNQSLSCNGAIYGLYPNTTFTPSCTGSNETIVSDAYAGEYSNVNIAANQQYVFSSSVGTDFISITNSTGTSILASGQTPLSWSSGTNTGVVRYYLHSNSSCGSQGANRVKYMQCATSPSCGLPTQLSVSNITSNSCRLNWTAPATTPTNYDIYIITSNTAPTSTTTASATTTSAGVGVLSGISAATTYYYWIRSNCNGTKSAWVSGGSFTTLAALTCNSATYGLYPNATFTPTCNGSLQQIVDDAYASEYSNVNVSSNKQYTFTSSVTTDYITITNGDGTVVLASGVTPLVWNSTTTSGVIRYYFSANANCGAQNTERVRSIKCQDSTPTCNPPGQFWTENITATTAILNWTSATPTPDTYLYLYNTEPTIGGIDGNTTSTSANIDNLSPNTDYHWWVASVCGNDQTEWVYCGSFTTLSNTLSCWETISAGYTHSVGIRTDGTLWAWGDNGYGQLGDGTTIAKSTPTQIGTANNWQSVSASGGFTLAIKADGTLWAWGNNTFGQLGDGTTTNKTTPTQIGTSTNWIRVTTGEGFALAIRDNGALWAWGNNNFGQLGDGTTVNKTTPTQIGTDTSWLKIAAGSGFSLAIKMNGTLWTWGSNTDGQLGNGTTNNATVPTQIGTDDDWADVAAGYNHSVGKKLNGLLLTWGNNAYGQLGDGTNTNRLTPVSIFDQVQNIDAGWNYTVGTITYGNMFYTGENTYGQLGDGTTNNTNLITVTNSNNHELISAGAYHTFSLNTDASLSVCGLNGQGRLGDGTTNNSSNLILLECSASTLSNEEFNRVSKWNIYPNPVNNVLNVSFDENIANISIYNLLGQEVIYKTINANQGSVDVSNLAAGTYLIRVTSHNEEVKTLKIIKE